MMNTDLKPYRSGKASHTFTTSFQGEVCRKAGNLRAATLDGQAITPDNIFSAAKAVKESLDEAFGATTTHDGRLEADRKAYALKGDIGT